MKYRWLSFFIGLALSPFVVVAQAVLTVFTPRPIADINLLAVVSIFLLLIFERGAVVWWSFIWFGILDWYTVGPFGVVFSAGVLATLVLVWLYRGLLTNRGVFSAAILTAVFILVFRVFYAFGFMLTHQLVNQFDVKFLLLNIFIELIMTTGFVSCLYFILAYFLPSLKVTHTKQENLYARH